YSCPSMVGSGLHVNVSKIGTFKNHAVGNTVESHTASETKGTLPGLLLNIIQKSKIVLLQDGLRGGRQIHIPPPNLRSWNPGRAEYVCHLVGEYFSEHGLAAIPGHVHALAVMGKVVQIQAALVIVGADKISNLLRKPGLSV